MTTELQQGVPDLRAVLGDKDFFASTRANVPAGMTMRSPAELEESLDQVLGQRPDDSDLHIFGYGSLMWNPAFEHDAQLLASVQGWHRRFCIRNLIGRGTAETPGLMLALDAGGSCNGMLLRIPARKVRDELRLLWRREMSWGTYHARWVTARVGPVQIKALTFVVNRRHERYLKALPLHEAVRMINSGKGSLGTCRAYFDATVQKLGELGIRDRRMEELHAAVRSA